MNNGLGVCNSGALQDDGKIVLAGGMQLGASTALDFCIARLNSDGSPDTTFDIDARTGIDMGSGINTSGEVVNKVVIQPDGKIVACGQRCYLGDCDFAVARFMSDGSLDSSFGTTGVGYTVVGIGTAGSYDIGKSLLIQPDGKIVVGGSSVQDPQGVPTAYYGLLRLNPNGSIDSTFANNGQVMDHTTGFGRSVVLQSDNKIIEAGFTRNDSDILCIARYNANGTPDLSFNGTGNAQLVHRFCYPLHVGLQSDGKILTCGYYQPSSANVHPFIARYGSDGIIDDGFGDSGKVAVVMPGNNGQFDCVIQQPDGKILAGGYRIDSINSYDYFLMRFLTNGMPDTTFGSGGMVITDYPGPSVYGDQLNTLLLQTDNKIVATGNMNGTYCAVRYLNNMNIGILEFSSSDMPVMVYPNPIGAETILKYELRSAEKISIVLYDLSGKLISALMNGEKRTSGTHAEELHIPENLPAGNYLIAVSNGNKQQAIQVMRK